jgi:Spy/CpxP family protein refolding chaperone
MLQHSVRFPARTLVIGTALAIAFMAQAPPAAAGTPGKAKPAAVPAQALDHYTTTMRKQLTLTPEQEQAARPIFKKFLEKRAALRQQLHDEGPVARRQLRKQMKNLRSEEDKELRLVLTPKQMEKLTAFRTERMKEMQQRRRQQGTRTGQQQ